MRWPNWTRSPFKCWPPRPPRCGAPPEGDQVNLRRPSIDLRPAPGARRPLRSAPASSRRFTRLSTEPAAAVRVPTPGSGRQCLLCLVTVRGLERRMSALSRWVSPRATECSSPASRWVSMTLCAIASGSAASSASLATISHSALSAASAGPALSASALVRTPVPVPGTPPVSPPVPPSVLSSAPPIACSANGRRRPLQVISRVSGAAPAAGSAAAWCTQCSTTRSAAVAVVGPSAGKSTGLKTTVRAARPVVASGGQVHLPAGAGRRVGQRQGLVVGQGWCCRHGRTLARMVRTLHP